jgi:magnesium transporter
MRVFHVMGDQLQEWEHLPDELPPSGYVWLAFARREFEVQSPLVQARLLRWQIGQIFEPHISDLISQQLPSHFDYTSWYDILVFRRLAAGAGTQGLFVTEEQGTLSSARSALASIDTSPVGFALFDRLLVSVHPLDCQVREYFAQRLHQQVHSVDSRGSGRLPSSAADLMLRMVNHMVDSYLDLRRMLSRQFSYLQQELFNPKSAFEDWQLLLESRNTLHLLEDTCEDQRSALTEWIDALDEWPVQHDEAAHRERELLRVKSRDVLEHIERVISHVKRLESSAETAVQMHFSAQTHRTNHIMRTLTVLTAIFMPLNLVTGYFGMNFDGMPLIHSRTGFWVASGLMLVLGLGLSWWFWRHRYLGASRR